MFLRKIFASRNKLTWVIIDLMIVIIGVYCAFLIQSYSEREKTTQEKEKIYSALKYELEIFRYTASQIASGTSRRIEEWNTKIRNESYIDFSNWRFIEPQYRYQIIEHSINIDNNEIIDFELYTALQRLFLEIKKVEHTERLITEVALHYKTIPAGIEGSKEARLITYENFDHFKRFTMFTQDRITTLQEVVLASNEVLSIINERLPRSKRHDIEADLIRLKIPDFPKVEVAIQMIQEAFPDWTEEEIRELFRDYSEESKDSD